MFTVTTTLGQAVLGGLGFGFGMGFGDLVGKWTGAKTIMWVETSVLPEKMTTLHQLDKAVDQLAENRPALATKFADNFSKLTKSYSVA